RTQFELLNIQERLGVTFIVVTHDQEEAMTLATRMGVMDRGQIVQVGTPAEIYESPVNRFVADFIGSVNLLEGSVAALGGNDLTIRCDAAGCTVRVARQVECVAGDTVWAAIRPEKIALSSEGSSGESLAENRVRGKVREVAYMGDVSICLVEIESGKTFRVTLPNRAGIAAQRDLRHASVTLSWEPESPVILTR
ncbi:MAG: TOBE domain-containing protein, partial [Steroidobacteraceae bacterium]